MEQRKKRSRRVDNHFLHYGIIFPADQEENIVFINQLKSQLKAEGDIVKSLGVCKENRGSSNQQINAISGKDVKWNGVPESPLIDEFLYYEYDVLLCAVTLPNPSIEFIVKLADAKLKMGVHYQACDQLFDIIIDSQDFTNINLIFDQFFTHLKLIRI